MKRVDHIILVLLLSTTAIIGCKKVTIGKYTGASGSDSTASSTDSSAAAQLLESQATSQDTSVAAEEATYSTDDTTSTDATTTDSEAAVDTSNQVTDPVTGTVSETRFDLVKYILSKSYLSSAHKYVDSAGTMMTMGDQKMFKIETNGTYGVSPNFDTGAEERKLVGAYWMKAYAANKLLTNDNNETGLFLDVGAEAILDKLNIDMHFRYVGNDIASRSVLAGFDQLVTRSKEIGGSIIPLIKASVNFGGESGLRTEFGVRRDDVLNLIYTPKSAVYSGASVTADLIIVSGTLDGQVRIMDLGMKGAGNLGQILLSKMLYSDVGVDKGDIKLLDGKVQFITKLFGAEVRRDDIWNPAPVKSVTVPTYGTQLIKFSKEPKDNHACQVATANAALYMAGTVGKMAAYFAAAPEEDKPAVKGSMGRAGYIYRMIKSHCNGAAAE